MKPNQLEESLIQFAVDVILACKKIDVSFVSGYLAKQLISECDELISIFVASIKTATAKLN
jgi:hypothetical protein